MAESFKTRLWRSYFNVFPAYRGSGGRVTYIARDWSEVRIRLPLSWRTRNYVGTIYGGSMYGAVDPMYMVMLIKRLGAGFVVWDKSAAIRFKRPGRSTLHAVFTVDDDELREIHAALETDSKVDRQYRIELKDGTGEVCALVEKTVHIKRRPSENGVT